MLVEVLAGLINGRISRGDVYRWYQYILEHHATQYPGCVTVHCEQPYSEFVVASLAFILDKGISNIESEDEYFLRDEHFAEYICGIQKRGCVDVCGKIKRLRSFEMLQWSDQQLYPLVIVKQWSRALRDRVGVLFERGSFDDLCEHKECAIIMYEGSPFVLSVIHRPMFLRDQFSIEGFANSENEFVSLVRYLELDVESITYFNEDVFVSPTELWRLDDNGNKFLIEKYSTYVEASMRLDVFESKQHKQKYYLRNVE